LYAAVSRRVAGCRKGAAASATAPSTAPTALFRCCRLYFTGRIDGGGGGLSSYSLGKLARLHGAEVTPHLTKRGVTHVICTQLAGAKERAMLKNATSRTAVKLHVVRPKWITESVGQGRRLSEARFSLLAEVAQDMRVSGRPISAHMASAAVPAPASSTCGHGTREKRAEARTALVGAAKPSSLARASPSSDAAAVVSRRGAATEAKSAKRPAPMPSPTLTHAPRQPSPTGSPAPAGPSASRAAVAEMATELDEIVAFGARAISAEASHQLRGAPASALGLTGASTDYTATPADSSASSMFACGSSSGSRSVRAQLGNEAAAGPRSPPSAAADGRRPMPTPECVNGGGCLSGVDRKGGNIEPPPTEAAHPRQKASACTLAGGIAPTSPTIVVTNVVTGGTGLDENAAPDSSVAKPTGPADALAEDLIRGPRPSICRHPSGAFSETAADNGERAYVEPNRAPSPELLGQRVSNGYPTVVTSAVPRRAAHQAAPPTLVTPWDTISAEVAPLRAGVSQAATATRAAAAAAALVAECAVQAAPLVPAVEAVASCAARSTPAPALPSAVACSWRPGSRRSSMRSTGAAPRSSVGEAPVGVARRRVVGLMAVVHATQSEGESGSAAPTELDSESDGLAA